MPKPQTHQQIAVPWTVPGQTARRIRRQSPAESAGFLGTSGSCCLPTPTGGIRSGLGFKARGSSRCATTCCSAPICSFHHAGEKNYTLRMTRLLDRALEAVRSLPPDAQDDIARIVLQLAGSEEVVSLSPEEQAAIDSSKAAAARGEFATDDQVRFVWSKRGL